MSQQNSRSNDDPRANRLPYHSEARQGRFGRVENWREAEEKKIEELRQRRKAASRTNARQQTRRQSTSYQRPAAQAASQQSGHPPIKSQQSSTGRQRAQQHIAQHDVQSQQEARQGEEVNPWQQGRFGRVENWREVEERRRLQEQQLEQQREAARQANRQTLQTPTQQAAQKRMQKSAQRSAEGQAPMGAHSKQAPKRPREGCDDLSHIVSKHPTHTPVGQSVDEHDEFEIDIVESVVPASGKLTAKSYARDSYTSSSRASKEITFNASGTRSTESKYDRRPAVEYAPNRSRGAHSRKDKRSISPKLIAVIAVVFLAIIGIGAFNIFSNPNEDSFTQAGQTGGPSLPTPIMSESSGITMHSAVAAEDLTEILIHNASYAYANEITTQLAEATNTEVIAAHGTGRVASEQPTGDQWLTGEFVRCFRSGNAGPTMSAIDCGGPVGATVYAPVSGEVVLVKEYKLYDQIDDYRIHIQPTGRPDLDVVLIHLTDVTVKAGDKVTAGVTPIAKIRDIFQFLDESLQLKNYTAENDNGNHTHIQVNNANHPEYTALDELKPPSENNTPATQ